MYDKSHLYKIHRYLTGECSSEEKTRIEKWIGEDPANRQIFEAVQKIWEVEPEKELQADLREAWNRLEKQMDKRNTIRSGNRIHELKQRWEKRTNHSGRRRWWRIAAILLLGLFLSLYVVSRTGNNGQRADREQPEMVMQEIRTDRAHQSEMTFTDGTVVRLNAASYIRFPSRFTTQVREVYLEGEAWFDVKHNPDVEFVVQTRDATVRVLGTEFNVKAHDEDTEVEVVVADGTVAVQSSSELPDDVRSEVLLTKGEMSRIRSGDAPAPAQQVDTGKYLSWLRGNFVFEETPFDRVLSEWERRFDVDFVVEDESLLETPFTGEFRHESFDEMLRLTSITLEFDYNRENNTITIKK